MSAEHAKKVAILFPGHGRAERQDAGISAAIPREFFYGMEALTADGHDVVTADTRRDPDGIWPRTHLRWEILRNRLMRYGTSAERVRAVGPILRQSDVALSFTDGFSISLGLHARRMGARARLVGGFHGISTFTERTTPGFQSVAAQRTSRAIKGLDHAFFFGAADRAYAIDTYDLKPENTSLFRFGIDTEFWQPGDPDMDGRDGVVFSVGSDLSRDYETLLSAPTDAPLRILTRLRLNQHDTSRVEHISGSFHGIAITDSVLRDMYRRAAIVAVPLHDVLQPTGYSVTLQAMACAKPVVITDIRGLWDRDAFVSGENCILVPPGDTGTFADAINLLRSDEELRRRIGAAARTTAEQVFPLARMDASIRALLSDVINGARLPKSGLSPQ